MEDYVKEAFHPRNLIRNNQYVTILSFKKNLKLFCKYILQGCRNQEVMFVVLEKREDIVQGWKEMCERFVVDRIEEYWISQDWDDETMSKFLYFVVYEIGLKHRNEYVQKQCKGIIKKYQERFKYYPKEDKLDLFFIDRALDFTSAKREVEELHSHQLVMCLFDQIKVKCSEDYQNWKRIWIDGIRFCRMKLRCPNHQYHRHYFVNFIFPFASRVASISQDEFRRIDTVPLFKECFFIFSWNAKYLDLPTFYVAIMELLLKLIMRILRHLEQNHDPKFSKLLKKMVRFYIRNPKMKMIWIRTSEQEFDKIAASMKTMFTTHHLPPDFKMNQILYPLFRFIHTVEPNRLYFIHAEHKITTIRSLMEEYLCQSSQRDCFSNKKPLLVVK